MQLTRKTNCILFCVAFALLSVMGLAQTKKPAPQKARNAAKSKSGLEATAITKIEPEFPPIAKAAHASGNVEVEVKIDEEGNVSSAKAFSGHPLLRTAAETAAKQWKFKPAKLGETPVKVEGVLTFNFALEKTEPKTKRAAKTDPAEELCDQAYKLSEQGRYEEAIVKFQASLRHKPDYAWALFNLGTTYIKVEQYANAELSCAKALKIRTAELKLEGDGEQDMIYENSIVCLGLVDLHLRRYDDAIARFRKVAELEKSMTDVRFFLGLSLISKGEIDAGIAALKESIAIRPSSSALFLLGDTYLKIARFKDAIDSYRQCIELEDGPLVPSSRYGIGIAFLKLGDKQSAMNEYKALKKMNNERAEQLLIEINK